jgi:hypothetical protein
VEVTTMAKDGSTHLSDEEREYTAHLPHGSNAPENADTASGGPADPEPEDDDEDSE